MNPKGDKLGAGAAVVHCERAGEATTRDGGLSNVKASPSRVVLVLAACLRDLSVLDA